MTRAALALAATLLLGACAASGPAAPPSGDFSLKLERGPCFGFCPSYSVEIRGDGQVAYFGERFVVAKGERRRQIDPAAARALLEKAEAARFFSLKDAYRAQVTDLPTYQVTVTAGGRSKTVVDYMGPAVGMPAAVRELEDAIDQAAGTAEWVGTDEQRQAMMPTGG